MTTSVQPAAVALAIALGALAGGCGGDDDVHATTTTAESTTTTAAPEVTAGPTTTVSTTPPCGAVSVPATATEVTELEGEVDGDGRPDALRTFLVGDVWHLQVEVAAGGGADLDLATSDAGGVGLVGGADVDGDGRDEIWARVGSGASATILGLARYDACALVRVTIAGSPADLPVGGSVGSAAGVECRSSGADADLSVFSAMHRDESQYDVTTTSYELQGPELVPGSTSTSSVDAADDAFIRYTSFTCGELGL
ncbi:MAG TPA: hypothetical protein VFV32_02345 [Acidimicrobiales bacterium]|nr:hypothetical protein [Acidimicrobiales bacterium]